MEVHCQWCGRRLRRFADARLVPLETGCQRIGYQMPVCLDEIPCLERWCTAYGMELSYPGKPLLRGIAKIDPMRKKIDLTDALTAMVARPERVASSMNIDMETATRLTNVMVKLHRYKLLELGNEGIAVKPVTKTQWETLPDEARQAVQLAHRLCSLGLALNG
jgi:hypothetical protein